MAEIRASRGDIETFAAHLVDDTVDRILGAHITHGERTPPGMTPRTTFFSGVLSPEEDDDSGIDDDIQSRMSPSSLGLIGRVSDTGDGTTVSFTIDLSFALYYRVIPTPSDQEETGDTLPVVYRKCKIGTDDTAPVSTTITFDADTTNTGHRPSVSQTVEKALNEQVEQIIDQEIASDPTLYGGESTAVAGFISQRETQETEHFLEEVADAGIGGDQQYVPRPDLSVDVRVLEGLDESAAMREDSDTAVVRVDITNDSDPDIDFSETDLATYETQLELRGTNGTEFTDVIFEDVPEGFRYDQTVPGQGHNCTAEWTDDKNGLRSVTVPIYQQPYFRHRHEYFSGDANPEFETLADNPLPVLRSIRRKLKEYKQTAWADRLETARNEAASPESDAQVTKIEEAIKRFEQEIDRFDRGVSLLEDNQEARELFKQMNEVFLRKVRQGDPTDPTASLEYPGWRPFQIVFIVSVLPDVLSEGLDIPEDDHDREKVDLLYFPTGGGKTEAYLALIVFSALFDRRRGKEFGLSTMMRFPLRLLTLQQFQRVVEILVHADEVRKEVGYGGEPFSAGFFTGNTANKLNDLLEAEFELSNGVRYPQDREQLEENRSMVREFADRWNQTDDKELEHVRREDYRAVEECPLCGSDVALVFNTETDRVEHHCSAPADECEREALNVHVTDNDIYRAVPTAVIGTQDKLAAIGYTYRFRTLAGYTAYRCPKHGYTHQHDDCLLTWFCGRDDPDTRSEGEELERVTPYNLAPTLVLQDELHLVNEDLGTFESHYYSAFEKHLEWAAEKRGYDYTEPKKIAATATIEESDNQVKHLYGGKTAIRFPAPGPDYRESAYTTTDDDQVQRHYIGVTPWNRSQINSIIRLLEMHQRRMQDWLDDPETALDEFEFDGLSDPDTFQTLLDHYYTLVTYVISKFESGRLYKSAENQVNDNLTSDGYSPVQRFDMQGNTDPDAMADMLNRFEQVGEKNGTTHEDVEGLVTATSSISHGVDLDALGYMVFFNAPPRMSEYIQASSRVGRSYPGLVLDVFDPIGERDRSHYHYFNKYHEYLDRLVEPVAINRWAKFSVERTFPGLFMSLLYNKYFDELVQELGYFGNWEHPRKARRAEQAGVLDQDQIIEDLIEIYGDDWETGECPFADQIERLVQDSFNRIQRGDERTISDCLKGRVMTSLRDVDEPIPINPSKKQKDAFRAVGVDIQ